MAFCESLIDGWVSVLVEGVLLEGRMAYPVEGVGEGVFTEVGEDFVVNLESGEVCWRSG